MADGSGVLRMAATGAEAVRLDGCGTRIWARCRCGRSAAIDPAPWLAQGLGSTPLHQLERRLRCLCGARRVPLETGSAPATPSGVWIFL